MSADKPERRRPAGGVNRDKPRETPERRDGQRRQRRIGRCRRCGGLRWVRSGPDEEMPNGTGDIGTPVKRCSCIANKNSIL